MTEKERNDNTVERQNQSNGKKNAANSLASAVKPQREALPYSRPENISTIEKAIIELSEELSNLTELREALEHSFEQKRTDDGNFQIEVVKYFNSLQERFKELSENLKKNIDYSVELEERVKSAELSRQVYILERELISERAKITLFIDEMSALFKEKLGLIENKCVELKGADTAIQEAVVKFRMETSTASESEYRALKANCENMVKVFTENAQKTLEALKTQSINFLNQCENENKSLIRKVPEVRGKLGIESYLVITLGVLGVISFFASLSLR